MPRQSLLALLLAGLTLTAGCSFLATNPDSHTSTVEYSVGLDATATLEDATIRVPLPQTGDEATVGASVVAPNGTVEAFDASVVETRHGPMLELTAETFAVETRYFRYVESDGLGRREEISEAEYDPSNPDHVKKERRTVSVRVTQQATYPIETRSPVGASPTFVPDATRELAVCSVPSQDETACFDYDAPLYLAYDTADAGTVSGHVVVSGSNEWFAGGWTGNSYADSVTVSATGPQDGWTTGNGTTETGRGTYPTPEA